MNELHRLYVFYDAECALCRRCRKWLEVQATYIPLHLVAFQSDLGPKLFPDMASFHPAEQLLVIGDNGDVYQGSGAWIMCLYALKEFRGLSLKLAQPGWRHLAKKLVSQVSVNRASLSKFFRDHQLSPGVCDAGGSCA
ncbi:MAG: DCC1-like thiol-disulfide oxidoreductase family protein [Verrucomicrobiota bacterium]